jgi:hypothetical protein
VLVPLLVIIGTLDYRSVVVDLPDAVAGELSAGVAVDPTMATQTQAVENSYTYLLVELQITCSGQAIATYLLVVTVCTKIRMPRELLGSLSCK